MISFINKGEIDPRAIRTFGANVKEGDNPIGFFGTGLKYAVAIALRLGCKIRIFSGKTPYEFTTQRIEIRGKAFDVVCMNGEELGFTTELGKNWEAWQAFRELYCNMLDEKGVCVHAEVDPLEGQTVVQVDGEDFDNAYYERHEVVLQGEPKLSLFGVDIYNRPSKYLYYRGVRVGSLPCGSLLTYSVTRKQELTEDRTLKYEFLCRSIIAEGLMHCEDESIMRQVLTADELYFESKLSFNSSMLMPSATFNKVVGDNLRMRTLNQSALEAIRRRNPNEVQPRAVVLREDQKEALDKARDLLVNIGYDVAGYDVRVTDELPEGILGCVYRDERRIYLNSRTFTMGENMVAGTLMEEFLHVAYDLKDESRALQNHLIDKLIETARRT